MKLIVGLGNLGKRYENTRHNVGFLVLEELKNKIQISNIPEGERVPYGAGKYQNDNFKFKNEKRFKAEVLKMGDVILAKPQTFMNNSGVAVSLLYTLYKIHNTDLFIIHDDLDIKLGEYKIQFGKGPKIHNGLLSIYEKLGTRDFWHVRVGIENRNLINTNEHQLPISKLKTSVKNTKFQLKKRIPGEEYVLQKYTEEEKSVLGKTINEVVAEIINLVNN